MVDTLAIVTTDGAPYMLCSDAQNVLWKRSFAGDDLSWTEMSGVPTGPIALCAGGSALYIIAKGALGVYINADGGTLLNVATLGPSNLFAEISLLTGDACNATVRAD